MQYRYPGCRQIDHGVGRHFHKVELCLVSVLGLCLSLALFASPVYGDLLAEAQERDLRASLVGSWVGGSGRGTMQLRLSDDGTFAFKGTKGRYEVKGATLTIRSDGGEASYGVKLEGKKLTLSSDDLSGPLTLYRRSLALDGLSLVTAESAGGKLVRILLILVIVVVALLVIGLLRWLSHVLIYSDWGPLRHLYARNKSRIRTIHSLGLNVFKYIVYVLAVGFVLSQLGVNYTAYFVSLSFIGLAIGFGAQGLVQDMVTGLFLLVEGQFEVGDMVNISNQVGIITDFGLRMTRLRNYLGQAIFIPNRNISIVGRFLKGSQQVWLDVHVADQATSDQGVKLLRQVGEEVAQQFGGVMLKSPEVSGPRSLAGGGQFLRMAASIWPNERWVIEQQLIPRIREAFKRVNIEIPGDRIVAFYHAGEKVTVSAPRIIPRISRKGEDA